MFRVDKSFGAEARRKRTMREARGPHVRKIPIWWVVGICIDEGCADDRKRNKAAPKHQHLCQICRLCQAHCLGHRGILEGLRAVLTVHKYD